MLFKFGPALPANSDNVVLKLILFVGDSLRVQATGDWSTLEPEGFIFRRERFG